MTYSQGLKSEKVQTGVQWNGSRPSWHTYPRKQSWTCSFSRSAVSGSLQSWWLCSPPGSSVHGILQARILVRVAMSSSRGSSQPRDRTSVSYVPALAGGFFTTSATWEALQQIQANANTESISTSPFNTKGLFYPQQCFFASLISFFLQQLYICFKGLALVGPSAPNSLPWQSPEPTCSPPLAKGHFSTMIPMTTLF